ncbi:MAG: hypothetical protein GY948_23605 [Alphaproteobacteria bacterium]|nr:hypothetical protein [Alphaproteobacteria bacterium]
MTQILTWNIQNGKGVDDTVSLERIASVIAEMGDPDVICLQEVSRHMPFGAEGMLPDQVAELSELFPDHEAVFGSAVEGASEEGTPRWQFGNVTLTRLSVLSAFQHALPQPSQTGLRHMARQAIELTVETSQGPLRVVNTHLEFHSANQRMAQVGRLRAVHSEIVANAEHPPAFDAAGPYQELLRPVDCVLCGDFNMDVDSTEYTIMLNGTGESRFHDAWRSLHPGRDHDPTCGIYDHKQWPQGAHCRDFFFVTEKVARQIGGLAVNTETNASDHQPLMITLVLAP